MSWKDTYNQWKDHGALDSFVEEDLKKHETNESKLEDAFYKSLEFGTAGMRGVIGAGTNRMNVYTIRQATEGLAQYIEDIGEEAKKRGVAIAYDSRHFSKDFAFEAAKTLGNHEIKSYVFESLRPTPELSFAVRHLNAVSGIMITASHNPPEYNGYKVYNENGGQMLPNEADKLTDFVQSVSDPLNIEVTDVESLKENELLQIIGEKVDEAYLDLMKSVSVDRDVILRNANNFKIVYTPLHGTGQMLGSKALWNAGFRKMYYVEEQSKADPDFSTVKSPNPEDPEAFTQAIELGKDVDADVLIATDPDADRLGVAAQTSKGKYEVLTGNQIASLLVDYILKKKNEKEILPNNSIIVKSIVSSELPADIANTYGVETEDVLTGFKFTAEKIQQYQEDQSHIFMFGFEESYGYLAQPFVRDKDAIQALILVAEMTAYHKENNKTLYDALLDLYNEYGHYIEKTISIKMEGQEGAKKIEKLLSDLRENPLEKIGDTKVSSVEDYQSGKITVFDGADDEIDLPRANVIKYRLIDGSWIAIRPSGTEPKIKFYISVFDGAKHEADNKLEVLEKAISHLIDSI